MLAPTPAGARTMRAIIGLSGITLLLAVATIHMIWPS